MPAEIHPQSRLPFHNDPDPEPDKGLAVRFEGRPFGEQVRLGISYVRKLARKKWTAPQRLIDYLERQQAVTRALRELPAPESSQTAKVALLGDIMWIRDGWEGFPSEGTLAWLHSHDVTFANLETVISPRLPVPSFWPDAFAYNSHPGLIDSFKRADGSPGISAVTLANNHILDQGDDGARDTMKFLRERGIAFSGVRDRDAERTWCERNHSGIRIGFHAAGYGINDARKLEHSTLQHNLIRDIAPAVSDTPDFDITARAIDEMRAAGIDFIILSIHWGYEFEANPEPKLMAIAREFARRGADIVCGHHPHQPQHYETIFFNGHADGAQFTDTVPEAILSSPDGRPRKSLLIPSLGNFTSTMFTAICRIGFGQGIEIWRDAQTGRVDWRIADHRWFVNLARHPHTKKRALVTAEEFENLPAAPAKMRDALQHLRDFMKLDA